MRMQNYPRYASQAIKAALLDTPVVFVMGARQSGKTTLIKTFADQNWRFVNLDDQTQLNIIQNDPVGFINNLTERHIIIDEIQRLPELLLAIKQSVDHDRQPGRFLLTGSANALLLPQVADSLAGRIETILLNPLSECEINRVKPSFLNQLINKQAPQANQVAGRKHLFQRIVSGCFPEPLARTSTNRIQTWYKQYVNAMIQKDIKELAQIQQPQDVLKLLKLSAYFSAKLINFSKIGSEINLKSEQAKKYMGLLAQLFLLKQLPAWHSNQYKRLVKTPKLHLIDTGLICALSQINEMKLVNFPQEFGYLLETFVVNELQKQAAWIDQDLSFYHYRDKDKVEVDCIMEDASGHCFGVEVKGSATLTSKDFHGLKRFKEIAQDRFKMGVLLYAGEQTIPYGENLFAVPIDALWAGVKLDTKLL